MTDKEDIKSRQLSTKALGLYTRLLLAHVTVCRKPEIIALCPEKRSAVETMLHELIAHGLLKPLPEAPCRKSAYLVFKKHAENLISCYNNSLNNNDQQHKKESGVENQHRPEMSADYQQICADYQLPFAFLAEQIAIREKTIAPVTLGFVRGLLEYAKQHATKSYSGLVVSLFRSPTFFLPQFATPRQPIAQESGYTPPLASKPLARTPDAPGHKTPPGMMTPPAPPIEPPTSPPGENWQAYIEKRLDYTYFKTWILPCAASSGGGTVTITVPDAVYVDHLNELYLPLLAEALRVPKESLRFVVRPPEDIPTRVRASTQGGILCVP